MDWPCYVKLILAGAIGLLLFVLYLWVARMRSFKEGYVEETPLGTIRYPAGVGPPPDSSRLSAQSDAPSSRGEIAPE